MVLSEAEAQLIRERREDEERKARRRRLTLHYLKTAYEYKAWLQEHGAGSSYSTFCNEFGYQPPEDWPLSRNHIYNAVSGLIQKARRSTA
jgi:hypothetical protein